MSTPSDAELLHQLQQRIETVTAAKAANAAAGKALDEKLRAAFKSPPRRPTVSLERLQEDRKQKEWHRTTTSMSAADERVVLRELQHLQDKVAQHTTCDKFQRELDTLRAERQERFEQHKAMDSTLQQLQHQRRQLQLAAHLEKAVADFVTISVPIPADKMGTLIGKEFVRVHQLEKECCVILEVDNEHNSVKITSALEQVQTAKKAIEDVTLATSHAIGLHPDTVKVLMCQQAKLLRELEKSHQLKIDISKAEGILTVMASPDKAKQLENAIDGLTAGKVDIALPSEIVPKLIGKKGEAINKLMQDTGALVDIDKVTNNVRLVGTMESVADAEMYIQELMSKESQQEKNYTPENSDLFKGSESPPYKFEFFAEFLMANKAKQLRLLRADALGARIKVLKKERQIQVVGNRKQIDASESALRERLKDFEQCHWMHKVADKHLLSHVIGKKGSKIKEIERKGKESNVRIDIQDTYVCVFGDDAEAINGARATIMEIVDSSQRSVFVTSRGLITILMASKRDKLTAIENSSGCKLHLPPLVRDAAARSSGGESDQVRISVAGTQDAIRMAKEQLEELSETHHVQYLPLDDDEVPIVIGKNGETVADLETKSGSKVRVLRGTGGQSSELEMFGTQDQLKVVQTAVADLLHTQHRQLLQLDAFSTGCLIGKKGDRIKALRLAHPDATLDAFPNRGQVRVKAVTPEALQACVDDVLKTLRETHVVETVHVSQHEPQRATGLPRGSTVPISPNFSTVLEKNKSVAIRLRELEAEGGGGMRVSIEDGGMVAKIRGPALGIRKIKEFLEMLVSPGSHFVETVPLPSIAFASALGIKDDAGKLNENALRICKHTGCNLRITRSSAAGAAEEGTVRIEGTNASNVYKAKTEVENALQFYYPDCFTTLDNLPIFIATRLYELLPSLRVKYNVVFSLPTKTSLKVFTDSKLHAVEIAKQLEQDVKAWKEQLVELPIAGWLVPILVGRNGDTIKKISTESNARLDLSAPSPSGSRHKDRVLTISSKDNAAVKTATEKVKEILIHHENLSSVVHVSKAKLDVALSVKKDAAKGVQFHVTDGEEEGDLQVVICSDDHNERERIVEMIEHLLDKCVVMTIALPTSVSPSFASSMIGSLIGKSGANIRALQKQFSNVTIDIRRDTNSITLKGLAAEVEKVNTVMGDKIKELLRSEDEFQQRRNSRCQNESEKQEDNEKDTSSAHDEKAVDETSQPLVQQPPLAKNVGPVGGTTGTGDIKLTKNQRRRMRKRAENEKLDALST
uniref:K Homology domain-containing protein n=1 Tax=Peronospora matthiolae TaxID=2874970 RepID=A0AAV1TZX0_9STRA